MKKIFTFIFAALMSASMFAQPAAVPTVQDVAAAGYDVANARVICLYFDEQVCNDIVWVGTYRVNEVGNWSTNVEELSTFESLENYPGWYVVEVDDARAPQADQTIDPFSNCCVGKPVQLRKDGSFYWDFQTGDAEAWINMAQPGTKQHYIFGGYADEADICWNEYGVYIYEVAYFKSHNTPCGEDKPKHDYTITAYLPEFCAEIEAYADSVRVMGGFDRWTDGIWMEKKIDEDFNDCWYAEIKDVEEGTEFKLRFGTDAEWKVQVQLDGQNLGNERTGETTDIVLQYNGEGYSFKACAAPIEYKYTEYENWQIKYGPDWTWSEKMTKVADGLYEIGIIWGNTGFNIKSDDNPIKQDWYALDDPAVTVADGLVEGEPAKVTLRIVDDKTLVLNIVPTLTTIPTVQDVARAGFDVTNARVICLYFDEQVCNDIVWVGSYNGWNTDSPADMLHFEPLEGFAGWYVVEVVDDSDVVMGKPVQLKKDGSFSWDFMSGDAEAWINMGQPGSQTATFNTYFPGEADATWPTTGVYIYELAYFKNHNTPCAVKPVHDYTITAYLPEFCDDIKAYADSVRVMGGFDNWTDGVWMEKRVDENLNLYYYAELTNVEEGTEFKIRCGTDADWNVQVQLNGENFVNETLGETTNIVLQYDGEGYNFKACEQNDVIIYTATEKLSGYNGSLDVGATTFGPAIISHTFNNGTGTITCNGEITTIGSNAFYYCTGLTSISIPNSVTTIGGAFIGCRGLTSITIPNSVTTIGNHAFDDCTDLTSINVASDNTHYISIDGVLFNYAKDILIKYPARKTRIAYTIPNSVTTIGNHAFEQCYNLTSITIPNSIITIGDFAFWSCYSLTSITIPNSVTTIGMYAFDGCSSLTSVSIPNSVTKIGDCAFIYCIGLTSINVAPNNMHYTSVDGVLFNYAKDTLIQYPIGNTRTAYTIPNSVTTFWGEAFAGCTSLTSVTIPNSVTTIGRATFMNCSGLTSITIPNSVRWIGESAFSYCSGLTSITSYAINPPSCGTNCFNKVDKSIPVYVPFQSVLAYKQANEWKDFTNIQRNPYDYAIVSCSTKNGTISGAGKYIKGDKCTLTVTANYGYHFVQWNDGITDNPRSFILTQDTSFIAQIAVNQYTLTAQSADNTKGTVVGGGTYDYQSQPTITAIANYGYRFLKWNDGNTANPRKFTLTKDTTFIAQFTPKNYQVTVQNANSTMGSVFGSGSYSYLSVQTISATANYGYHFVQWSDGVTDNPRTIQVLGDTTFTATFSKNQYLISVETEHGEANGGGYYEYLSSARISVTADEHYHFVKWSDDYTSNPRTISVTGDKIYTAICTIDQFAITATATNGVVNGTGKYDYGKEITLIVVPNFCHEFAGWSDGNMDNPRKVTVLENAQYTAQCKRMQVAQGTCGYNVYWTLDLTTGVLTISGNGAMTDYTSANQTPWYDYLSFTTFSSLIIEDGVTHIGNYAFYGLRGLITISLPNSVATIGHHAFAECQDLEKVAFGAGLQSIGDYAFYNDIRIEEMTCLASRTPDVSANTFGNVSHFAWVYVQSEYFHKYEVNMYWNVFVLKTIEAEPAVVQEDDVTVTPSTDNATIVWPANDAAAEYTLEITKDGVVFCTLTFNAQGQLIGIAFAPSRDGELRTMSNAEMTVNGWSFTVTGLNPGSTYSYTVDVIDAQKQSIRQYTGSFTTTGGVVTSLPTLMSTSTSGKILYNGHLYILRDGNLYTATGARVK